MFHKKKGTILSFAKTNQNAYIEREINSKIKILNDEIYQLEIINSSTKEITKVIKDIEEVVFESEKPLKEFDEATFKI